MVSISLSLSISMALGWLAAVVAEIQDSPVPPPVAGAIACLSALAPSLTAVDKLLEHGEGARADRARGKRRSE